MNTGYPMELRDLEYFAVVAEHGHLGRAAERLKLSQPALSKSLRRLEDALQVKLLRRSPKGVELTAEGSVLVTRVRELRLSLQTIGREVADVSQGHVGHIALGLGPIVPTEFISGACGELLRKAPRTTMKVTVSDADETIPALRSGQLDVIVNLMHSTPTEGLVHLHLYDDDYVVGASAMHRLAARRQVSLAELSEERWALSEPVLPTAQHLHEAFRIAGLPPPHVTLQSRSLALRLQTAAASDLLLYTSRTAIRQASAAGYALKELRVERLSLPRRIGVIHRNESYLPPAVRLFIEILKARAAPNSPFGSRQRPGEAT